MLRKISFSLIISFLLIFSASAQISDTTIMLDEFEFIDIKGENVPYLITKLKKIEIEEMPARDVGDFLRSSPNVAGIRKGGIGIDPVVRGFKYSQLNVQLNSGQKIEGGCPNRMDPAATHIDIDDIRKIEILKGPYALRFGPNFGGIINMSTINTLRQQKLQIHIAALMGYESNWNGMKQGLAVNAGNKDFFVSLSGNYKNYGDYKDGNGNTVKSSFKKYNVSGTVGFTPGEHHQFIVSTDFSYGRDVMFPALPMDERSDDTRLLAFDYIGTNISRVINSIHVKLYNSDVKHVMDNKNRPFSDTVVAISEIHAINSGYRAEIELNLGSGILFAGTDFENINKDGERDKYFIKQPTMPLKKEMLWDNALIQNFGFFAEYQNQWNKFRMVAAVRLDLNSATSNNLERDGMQGQPVYFNDDVNSNHTNFSLSLGGTYELNDRFSINLALGRGTRSPDMTERFIILLPIGYDKYDYLGNPSLKPETNNEIDLTFNHDCKFSGITSLNFFYSYVQDFISGELVPESEVKPQTKGVLGVKQFQNIGNVWLWGFELAYSTPTRYKWGVDLIGALTRGINPSATRYIIEDGEVTGQETVENDPLPEIPPLEASLSVHYKFLKGKLVPRLTGRFVAMQKKTSASFYENETPGFILADFSFMWNFNKYFSLFGGVKNIMNQPYYEHLNRNIIGSTESLYEPGRSFYVSLRFKI